MSNFTVCQRFTSHGIAVAASLRTHGHQCGAQYAEGFQVAKLWPRLRTERILP